MVRQAHAYLVSAISGATMIAVAIIAFVVLISAQVFTDWPIAALGGGNEAAAVSDADSVPNQGGASVGAAKTVGSGAVTAAAVPSVPAVRGGAGADRASAPQQNDSVGSSAPPVTSSEPVASGPVTPVGTGADPASAPGSSSPSGPSSSAGGGNVNSASTGSAGSGAGSGSKPSPGNVVEEVVAPVTGGGGSTSAKVTETVNGTVDSVDETVTGGALKEAGVTQVTEEVVNGVAGPESAVGKAVDEVGNAVGGLLGGGR